MFSGPFHESSQERQVQGGTIVRVAKARKLVFTVSHGRVKVLIQEAREAAATKLQVSAVVGILMFTVRTVSTIYFPGVLIFRNDE